MRSDNIYSRLRKILRIILLIIIIIAPSTASVEAQGAKRAPEKVVQANKPNDQEEHAPKLNFREASIEMLWSMYGDITGRTLLLAPKLPKTTITLRNETALNKAETLRAIEAVLAMHGIALIEEDEKFIRVVPISKAREEAMIIREGTDPEEMLDDSPKLISQMIALKHIDTSEAIKAITPFKHATYGKTASFERTNSILITDSAANINRMLQIIKHIDQPSVAREEPHIIRILYAKASDIKSKLEEIIAESQKQQTKKQTAPRVAKSGSPRIIRRAIPGVIRAPRPALPAPSNIENIANIIEQAERGIIRGKVQIIADERTNILIIITRPENMRFFEKIIKVLDIESGPDVIVQVFRLEFADAEEVASMLNSLIGATTTKKETPSPSAEKDDAKDSRSAVLREYVERQRRLENKATTAEIKSKVGELSAANVKILSDKRTNALIIMARKSDIATLSEIIKDMDTMLAQVLIESVIIEVALSDSLNTGVDWLQRSLLQYKNGGSSPILAHTGSMGGGTLTPRSAVNSVTGSSGGLTQYLTFFNLNLDAVIQMVATDTRARIISSPVILTTDNTEATITSTKKIYVFKGLKYDNTSSNTQTYDDYDTENVGLTLKVKPQINKNKVVMMTISQTMSEPGDTGEPVSGAVVSTERTMDASIAVKDRQTIVLGGQIRKTKKKTRTKVPLLGSIPLLGRLFSSNSTTVEKSEMIVFITPYVLTTDDEIDLESLQRKRAVDNEGLWKDEWSGSKMTKPTKKGRKDREKDLKEEIENRKTKKERTPKTMRPSKSTTEIDSDPELMNFIKQQKEHKENGIKQANDWNEIEE